MTIPSGRRIAIPCQPIFMSHESARADYGMNSLVEGSEACECQRLEKSDNRTDRQCSTNSHARMMIEHAGKRRYSLKTLAVHDFISLMTIRSCRCCDVLWSNLRKQSERPLVVALAEDDEATLAPGPKIVFE
ncbi:hypothetical protein NPIL_385831 [Nephila pilipes]|uniref:Uncharacterized protein n=1 Tax=Nephila pilipes TaxID=299642 RepID=A0A8X6PH32_NEPPI|nr:hypothetical protein NPIL_385831 [Nephila pilipes]